MPVSALIADNRDRWATAVLLRSFTARTGRWSTPTGEAWQPALAIEAMINTYQRTRDVSYRHVIEKSFARYRGRRSRFYDDDGWYLNAWLRAYDTTGDPAYLDETRALFTVLTGAWDEACRGGVWWNVERTYKNAITNELFLLSAASVYRRTGEAEYLRWARRSWEWFEASGLINPGNLVNDGLNGDCVNNGDTTWTYNQGVILSALVELWRIDGDPAHLDRAARIAEAALATLVHPGTAVLREPSEPDLRNKDAHVFKGIFAQGLARLYDADRERFRAFGEFLVANAESAWSARDERRGVGMSWRGPAGRVTAATHTSACLLFGHVASLAAPLT